MSPICSNLSREKAITLYRQVLKDNDVKAIRRLCREDLFFLLFIGFKRADINKDWLYDRCREVEATPDGCLDLWAREHYKSTIITYAKSIQDILIDPNVTIGIFSHTRPIAKSFLEQIKRELETNDFLKDTFPDCLYKEPSRESPRWSLDSGIIVKRTSNPKEGTCEAFGLVDGQPTSKHYSRLIYDDVVTRESVTTPEQIKKVTDAWALSLNLGAHGGKVRCIGTRYHYNDTYRTMIDRGSVSLRVHAATDSGKLEGKPVFLTREDLDKKRADMGPYIFCLGAGTRVMKSDFTNANIETLKVGDELVGLKLGGTEKGKLFRTRLVKSKVKAVQEREHETFEYIFEDGRSVISTDTHKWWCGRVEDKNRARNLYHKLGFGYNDLSFVCKAFDIDLPKLTKEQEVAASYIGGMFDADGCASGGTIHFSQSETMHPEVCQRIKDYLDLLGFEWSVHNNRARLPSGKETDNIQSDIYIRGGRQETYRFLHITGIAKRKNIEKYLFKYGSRNLGYKGKAKTNLVGIIPRGIRKVYNIETETGNYIAEGYVSSNSSQMLQNPTADNAMGFKEEWLRYYHEIKSHREWNKYLLCDPAGEKKKDNDYTVILVIALANDNNYYVIDAVRDRMNLTERTDKIFQFHQKYKPVNTGYEKYGKDSDIEHIKYEMEIRNYRFGITALGGAMAKQDRIRQLVPIFENGRFWLPHKLLFINTEGKAVDFVKEFIHDEYLSFPVSIHDDMLDCAARIVDKKLCATFPIVDDRIKISATLNINNTNRVETDYDVLA